MYCAYTGWEACIGFAGATLEKPRAASALAGHPGWGRTRRWAAMVVAWGWEHTSAGSPVARPLPITQRLFPTDRGQRGAVRH